MKHISKRERKHPTKKTTHIVARSELLANGKIWIRMERPLNKPMVDEQRPPGKGDDLKTEQ
jgi:hypothetical protein